jgi:hypothetical protein
MSGAKLHNLMHQNRRLLLATDTVQTGIRDTFVRHQVAHGGAIRSSAAHAAHCMPVVALILLYS